MKILIIEDEHFAELELRRLLDKCYENIEILACLDTVRDSVKWLKGNQKPDLVFMDIQLSDGLSFEIFKQVKLTSPVIFTTAYDEYAIEAFKVNSIDYLLKPIEQSDLRSALDKYRNLKEEFKSTQASFTIEQIESLFNSEKKDYKDRFVSKIGDHIKYILLNDVAYFYADDKIVSLVSVSGKKYIVDYSLDQLEPLLDPRIFFRLNRRYLAKIEAIESVARYFNGRLQIILSSSVDEHILVSREKAQKFKDWLEG